MQYLNRLCMHLFCTTRYSRLLYHVLFLSFTIMFKKNLICQRFPEQLMFKCIPSSACFTGHALLFSTPFSDGLTLDPICFRSHSSSSSQHSHHSNGQSSSHDTFWVRPNLRVRIVDENYKKGKYFSTKVCMH